MMGSEEWFLLGAAGRMSSLPVVSGGCWLSLAFDCLPLISASGDHITFSMSAVKYPSIPFSKETCGYNRGLLIIQDNIPH
jgi:hypothetical protein